MSVQCMCRLCASKSENYIDIYKGEGEKLNIATKIIKCLHIWLKPDDVLPKTVCMECCSKLDDYFDFFELCAQSQKSLTAMFKENKSIFTNKFDSCGETQQNYSIENNNVNCGSLSDVKDTGEITNDTNKNTNDSNNGTNDTNIDNDDYHFPDCDYGDASNICDDNNDDDEIDCDEEFKFKIASIDQFDRPNNIDNVLNNSGSDCHMETENPSSQSNTRSLRSNKCRTTSRSPKTLLKRILKIDNNIDSKVNKNEMNLTKLIRKRMSLLCSKKNRSKKIKPVSLEILPKKEVLSKTENSSLKDCVDPDNFFDGNQSSDEENEEKINFPIPNRKLSEESMWKCTDCPAVLKTIPALKNHHQVVHNQTPNFKCSHCTKMYTRYRSFARHMKTHSNPKKFSCKICGKSFSQKTVLQNHKTVHTNERPHSCQQCGRSFKQFSSLYLHSKRHLPEELKEKLPCTLCPKKFSSKHTLETHMKIHKGEKDFVCDVCGKSFFAKGSLIYHLLVHSDDKPYCCNVCNKTFKTNRLLTKHSTLHTGVKPHQCDVCGKQFRERSALKEHERIHTGAMPYNCEYCGKAFRFKGILTVHRRQHTGERPYSCEECNRSFTNWANYNKHLKRRHKTAENVDATTDKKRAKKRLIVRPDLHAQPISTQVPVHNILPTEDRLQQTPASLSATTCSSVVVSQQSIQQSLQNPLPSSQQSIQQPLQNSLPSQLSIQPLQNPPSIQQCEQPSPQTLITIMQQQSPAEVPPAISVQQLTPISGIQLHVPQPVMQTTNSCSSTSNVDNNNYKLLTDDQSNVVNGDFYQLSHFIPAHTITGMSYYIPSIQQTILPTSNI